MVLPWLADGSSTYFQLDGIHHCFQFGVMWFLSISALLNGDRSEVCVCGRVA